jgi:hypothetical protein
LKVLEDFPERLAPDLKLIHKLMRRDHELEYPVLLKWALQIIYNDGTGWVELCRIDNYPHEGHIRAHIHEHGKDGVRLCELDFDEAKAEIKRIASQILKELFNEKRIID